MEAERYTRFLSLLIGVNKAFRVLFTIRKLDEVEVRIEKE